MKCRGCDKEITFALNQQTNRKIPLEKVTVYETQWVPLPDTDGQTCVAIKIERDTWISHFLTCKKANDFSASKPPPAQGSFNGNF